MLEPNSVLQKKYKVIEKVAEGTYCTVYKAQDLLENRQVALKEIKPAKMPAEELGELIEIYFEEIDYLKSLNHKNMVSFYDAFREGGKLYHVTEWIEGLSLKQLMQKMGEPFKGTDVVSLFYALAEMVEYLHQQAPPYFMRILTSSDIIVDQQGVAKVVDMGIAKDFNPERNPEGYKVPDEIPDEQRDIFFLGSLIFELVTGIEPGKYEIGYLPSAFSKNEQATKVLSDIIDKCVARRGRRLKVVRNIRREILRWFPEYVKEHTVTGEKSLEEELIERERSAANIRNSCIGFIIILVLLGIGLYFYIPQYLKQQEIQKAEQCARNQVKIAKALNEYRKDHYVYPARLTELVPDYLEKIPSCPKAQTNEVYINSYSREAGGRSFKLFCKGRHHERAGIPRDYPRYSLKKEGPIISPEEKKK